MKAYTKSTPPSELDALQLANYSWNTFVQDVSYKLIKQALLAEQQHLCCYCESKLTHCHIEHLQPRNGQYGNTALTYDYSNLACSCNGGKERNRHCGHYKGSNFDQTKFINPSIDEPDKLFIYNSEGDIDIASNLNELDQNRARYMIQLLNLECPRLNSMRRSHWSALQDAIQCFIDIGAEEQIDDLALDYLTPDINGKLIQFFSLSRQLLGRRADVVLELLGRSV